MFHVFYFLKFMLPLLILHCWQVVIHAMISLGVSCFQFSHTCFMTLLLVLLDCWRYKNICWVIACEMFYECFGLSGLYYFLLKGSYVMSPLNIKVLSYYYINACFAFNYYNNVCFVSLHIVVVVIQTFINYFALLKWSLYY